MGRPEDPFFVDRANRVHANHPLLQNSNPKGLPTANRSANIKWLTRRSPRVTEAGNSADFPRASLPGPRVRACLLEPICSSAGKLGSRRHELRDLSRVGERSRCSSARCPRGGDRASAGFLKRDSRTFTANRLAGRSKAKHRCNHSTGGNPFPRSREYLRIVLLRRQLLFQGSR